MTKKSNPKNPGERQWTAPAGRSEACHTDSELKMSAVILTLAEPLLKKYGTDAKRAEAIIGLTIAAWNKAMLPDGKQGEVEKELIGMLVPPDGSAESVGAIVVCMDILEERRKELFPNLRTVVANYDFQMSDKGLTLNVGCASIPAGPGSRTACGG